MKLLKKIINCATFLILCGCTAHNKLVTDQKDAWISDPDKGLFYCKANLKDNGSADPVCFETGFRKYEEKEIAASSEAKKEQKEEVKKEQTKKKSTPKFRR